MQLCVVQKYVHVIGKGMASDTSRSHSNTGIRVTICSLIWQRWKYEVLHFQWTFILFDLFHFDNLIHLWIYSVCSGCANHGLWKHCNKSCLLILINHKQWCTVNMFQQHYQRRGGFLLFLPLRENSVITPWRCKRAKLFRVLLFHDIWTKI